MTVKAGIVMATMLEASPFVRGFGLQSEQGHPFPVYANGDLIMVISGIGKVAAALAAGFLIREKGVTVLHNAGAAGALGDGHKTGEILHVKEIIDWDRPEMTGRRIRRMSPDRIDGFPEAVLATLDRPVVLRGDRDMVGRHAEIIDMEGAGFLQACRQFGAEGYLWKLVSDTPEYERDSEIVSNIKKLSGGFFKFMQNYVFKKT